MEGDTPNSLARDIVQLHVAADQDAQDTESHEKAISDGQKTANRKTNLKDISIDFRIAASALETGQLVKDPYFTLFEAVGALEIMDPKMDSGFLSAGESLEDEFKVMRDLLPEEVVGLMDQMLCHEMAWHMGHPLSTSLFTSYHIDRLLWPEPKQLEDVRFDRSGKAETGNGMLNIVLQAYCIGLIKCCNFVHRRIGTEHYYEEEDFVSNLYNRTLLDTVETIDIYKLLDGAMSYTQQRSMDQDTKQAIMTRLALRQRLLSAVESDLKLDQGTHAQRWKYCLELMDELYESHRAGITVHEAFSTKIQRTLASSVPPRPMVEISFIDAYVFLKGMCRDASEVYNVLGCRESSSILNFTYVFQSRKPEPSVYVRCLLQSLIFHDMKVLGNITITKLIFDDLEELVLPADILLDPANGNVEAPHAPRFQMAKEMRGFVLRVGDPFLDMLRAICMNRSRMRRMLCHLVLDWESVQLQAENLDVELRKYTSEQPLTDGEPTGTEIWSFPLSSWAYYYKLRQMEWIVQLGFELNIYQNDELSGMYWYLSQVAGARSQHLERMQTFANRRLGRSKQFSGSQMRSLRRCLSFLDVALLETSATQWFAISLSKPALLTPRRQLYAVLSHFSLLARRPELMPYNSFELRHALRMKPFMQLSIPELPSYDELVAATSVPLHSETDNGGLGIEGEVLSTLGISDEAAKMARKEWEAISKLDTETARYKHCGEWWMASVKNIIRACIACSIAIATAKKGFQHVEPLGDVLTVEMPEAGKLYHDFWVVPKLSIRKQQQ
ncbi:MAG: hypothetical protein Q9216_000079 [Gyalolechia sp. 2 TL-2023]